MDYIRFFVETSHNEGSINFHMKYVHSFPQIFHVIQSHTDICENDVVKGILVMTNEIISILRDFICQCSVTFYIQGTYADIMQREHGKHIAKITRIVGDSICNLYVILSPQGNYACKLQVKKAMMNKMWETQGEITGNPYIFL